MSASLRNVLILIFPDVEVLDFAGPFEVFSAVNEVQDPSPFRVQCVARTCEPLLTRGGLCVTAAIDFAAAPPADLLILPGGHGTHAALRDNATMQWIDREVKRAEITLSVCTGARFLAAVGALDGRRATTHHSAIESVASMAPRATIEAGPRFVDEGPIITAAGVSAGIDASLHVIGRLLSPDIARETARYIEYDSAA